MTSTIPGDFNKGQIAERHFATGVVRRLKQSGYVAYFAGGCVRDSLMGFAPHDYDVATNATTSQVREVFGASRTRAVGEAFGVTLVHGSENGQRCQVEVATFRSDGKYSDGRRPDWVVFSTPEQDAQRRDFTINGLFYDPMEERVIDFVGGAQDIERGILRAIGDPAARIDEDKLRMLRAVRFASRFKFKLDAATEQAIRLASSNLSVVSGERLAAEMHKILVHPNRVWAIDRIIACELDKPLLPEMAERWSLPQHRESDLQLLANLPHQSVSFASALSTLVQPLQSHADTPTDRLVESIKQRWKLSNMEAESMQFSLSNWQTLVESVHLPWSIIQPLLVNAHVRDSLHVAEAIARHRQLDLTGIDFCRQRLSLTPAELNPPPLLLGNDLIAAGIQPGPVFSSLLGRIRKMQLDGQLQSAEQAMEWVRSTQIRERD